MKSLVAQNIPSPKEIFLPNEVSISSLEEVIQRIPINNIAKAIKKEWMYINCLLIIASELNSFFQLKYFGKNE